MTYLILLSLIAGFYAGLIRVAHLSGDLPRQPHPATARRTDRCPEPEPCPESWPC